MIFCKDKIKIFYSTFHYESVQEYNQSSTTSQPIIMTLVYLVFTLDSDFSVVQSGKQTKQGGAELCQAQLKLVLLRGTKKKCQTSWD